MFSFPLLYVFFTPNPFPCLQPLVSEELLFDLHQIMEDRPHQSELIDRSPAHLTATKAGHVLWGFFIAPEHFVHGDTAVRADVGIGGH